MWKYACMHTVCVYVDLSVCVCDDRRGWEFICYQVKMNCPLFQRGPLKHIAATTTLSTNTQFRRTTLLYVQRHISMDYTAPCTALHHVPHCAIERNAASLHCLQCVFKDNRVWISRSTLNSFLTNNLPNSDQSSYKSPSLHFCLNTILSFISSFLPVVRSSIHSADHPSTDLLPSLLSTAHSLYFIVSVNTLFILVVIQ